MTAPRNIAALRGRKSDFRLDTVLQRRNQFEYRHNLFLEIEIDFGSGATRRWLVIEEELDAEESGK